MQDGTVRQRKDRPRLQGRGKLALDHFIHLALAFIGLRAAQQAALGVDPIAGLPAFLRHNCCIDAIGTVLFLIPCRRDLLGRQVQHILIGGDALGQVGAVVPGLGLLPGLVSGVPQAQLAVAHQAVLGLPRCSHCGADIVAVCPDLHLVGGLSPLPVETHRQRAAITVRPGQAGDDVLHGLRGHRDRQEGLAALGPLLVHVGQEHLGRTAGQRRQDNAEENSRQDRRCNGNDQKGAVFFPHGVPFPFLGTLFFRHGTPPAAVTADPSPTGSHPRSAGRQTHPHRD